MRQQKVSKKCLSTAWSMPAQPFSFIKYDIVDNIGTLVHTGFMRELHTMVHQREDPRRPYNSHFE
jgi:hypothetical protein